MVRKAIEVKADCVMGNHEEKALRWRRHEQKRKADPKHYKNPMSSIAENRLKQWAAIPDEDWDWVSKLAVYLHISDSWTAVHGGCMPGIEVERQAPNEVMRLRYVKAISQPSGYMKYKMASLNEAGEAPDPLAGETVHHWTELWDGPRSIVYGHYTRDDIYTTLNRNGASTLGLDSGCVHGGTLSAAIFTDSGFSTHQVKANKVYVERRPWNDSVE